MVRVLHREELVALGDSLVLLRAFFGAGVASSVEIIQECRAGSQPHVDVVLLQDLAAPVSDVDACSLVEVLRDARPFVSILAKAAEKEVIFFLSPARIIHVWGKVVVPSVTALTSISTLKFLRNLRPLEAVLLNEPAKLVVILSSELLLVGLGSRLLCNHRELSLMIHFKKCFFFQWK